jgi:hypothetical protein
MTQMPLTALDTADAIELAELLQFITRWLGSDQEQLGRSLAHFASHPAYGTDAFTQPPRSRSAAGTQVAVRLDAALDGFWEAADAHRLGIDAIQAVAGNGRHGGPIPMPRPLSHEETAKLLASCRSTPPGDQCPRAAGLSPGVW